MTKELNVKEIGYSLLINSDDYITISTPETVLRYVNKAYCDLVQRPAEELIGRKFVENFSEAKLKKYRDAVKKITREEPNTSFTLRSGVAGDGKWVLWKETGIFDDNGNLKEILSVGKDISNVMEARREKENLLSTLTAFRQAVNTSIICTITDADGVITYANEKFCEVSKFTQEELIGQTHRIINSGYHPQSYFENIWETITGGKAWTGQLRNKAKDGTFYWVESVIIPIKNRKDGISGYLSLRIQIDEQKKAEESRNAYLRTMENMLYTVSHEIRKPITNIQGFINLMQDEMLSTGADQREIVPYLLASATELNDYSLKLNAYLEENLRMAQQ